jgi:SPP1 gp7 family putative phage head morphogenesis protein
MNQLHPKNYIIEARKRTGVINNFGFSALQYAYVDDAPDSRAWKTIHNVADANRGKVFNAVIAAIGQARLATNVKELARVIENRDNSGYLNIENEILTIFEQYYMQEIPPVLEEIVKDAGTAAGNVAKERGTYRVNSAYRIAAVTMAFDRMNPLAHAWALEHSSRLIGPILYETKQAIRQIIATAFIAEWSPIITARILRNSIGLNDKLAKAVVNARKRLLLAKEKGKTILLGKTKVAPGYPIDKAISKYETRLRNYRARMIARTETLAASNEGQRQLWLQARSQGLITHEHVRQWIFTGDARACPICEGLDGTYATLDGSFPGGYPGPPLHPNCRCSVGLSVRESKKSISRQEVPHEKRVQPIKKITKPPVPKPIKEEPKSIIPKPIPDKGIKKRTVANVQKALDDFEKSFPEVAKNTPYNGIFIKKSPGTEFIGRGRGILGLHKGTGEIYIYEGTSRKYVIKDFTKTTIHEIGHAFHTKHGIPETLRDTFLKEWRKLPTEEQYLMQHYVLNAKESFAETFSHLYGTSSKSGNIGRELFQETFRDSIELIEQYVSFTVTKGY